jgi:hypothetical protein
VTRRAQILIAALALGALAVADFATRVYVPRSAVDRGPDEVDPVAPALPVSPQLAFERLDRWLGVEAPPSGSNPAKEGSVPQAASEAAAPDQAEIGGRRFVLRGIFDAGEPFAVLDVLPEGGGPAEQHDLAIGEAVHGVRIEQIAGRMVTLSDGQAVARLVLFEDATDIITPAYDE